MGITLLPTLSRIGSLGLPDLPAVRLPQGDGTVAGISYSVRGDGPPLVLLLPGLDSAKEEFFNWETVFLQRPRLLRVARFVGLLRRFRRKLLRQHRLRRL